MNASQADGRAAMEATPSVGSVLFRAAVQHPRAEAVVDGDVRLSWSEVAGRVARLASSLRGLGLAAGDTVGVLADNSVPVFEMYFAAPMAGLVLLPLNTRLSGRELAACLDDAHCQVVVAGPTYVDGLHDAVADVRIVNCSPRQPLSREIHYEDLLKGRPGRPHLGSCEDMAYLYYTSGTSGRPKGVMLSHRNVISGAAGCAAAVPLGFGARWLHASPMFHLADAWAIWANTWVGGCHVLERFAPERTLCTLEDERISHTILVPSALERLATTARDAGVRLSGLKGLLYGGAPMPDRCWEVAVEQFDAPLIGSYGATETSGCITVLPWAEQVAPSAGGGGRVGHETPGILVDAFGPDDRPVPPGSVGELVVTSPAVMLGYQGRPVETAAALVGGRYHTGDLGVREGDGVWRLVGRSKDMIISGGENVYPAEVEGALSLHPGVRTVAVIGRTDQDWGETVVAVVEPELGCKVDLEALREFGRTRLALYKLPRVLVAVDALPVTGSGKVDKSALTALYGSNPAGSGSVAQPRLPAPLHERTS